MRAVAAATTWAGGAGSAARLGEEEEEEEEAAEPETETETETSRVPLSRGPEIAWPGRKRPEEEEDVMDAADCGPRAPGLAEGPPWPAETAAEEAAAEAGGG